MRKLSLKRVVLCVSESVSGVFGKTADEVVSFKGRSVNGICAQEVLHIAGSEVVVGIGVEATEGTVSVEVGVLR